VCQERLTECDGCRQSDSEPDNSPLEMPPFSPTVQCGYLGPRPWLCGYLSGRHQDATLCHGPKRLLSCAFGLSLGDS
jgi:hypothetical protein